MLERDLVFADERGKRRGRRQPAVGPGRKGGLAGTDARPVGARHGRNIDAVEAHLPAVGQPEGPSVEHGRDLAGGEGLQAAGGGGGRGGFWGLGEAGRCAEAQNERRNRARRLCGRTPVSQ